MNKQNLLSRAEMKKLLGGVTPEMLDEGGGGVKCRFKYRSGDGSWSNWTETVEYSFGDCNSWCLTFMQQGSVEHCGYQTM